MPVITDHLRFAEPLNKFLSRLPVKGLLLEIESGQGLYSRAFTQAGYSLVNIESPHAVFQNKNPYALDTHNKEITDVLVSYRSLSGIWAHETLSQRKRDNCTRALERFHEWLLPAGILYFCMPEGEGDKVITIQSVQGPIKKTQAYYTAEELMALLEYVDFKVLDAWREIKGDRSLLHVLAKRR